MQQESVMSAGSHGSRSPGESDDDDDDDTPASTSVNHDNVQSRSNSAPMQRVPFRDGRMEVVETVPEENSLEEESDLETETEPDSDANVTRATEVTVERG